MEPPPNSSPNPILRPTALLAGYSDNEIRRLRRTGAWESVRRGSYLPTDAMTPLTGRQRHELLIRSTIPALRVPAAVSHTSAAVLWGIPLWSTHLGVVHITRPRPANGGRSGSLLCHTAALSQDEITIINGVEVTTPARTIADLARVLPFEQAVVAADGALHMKLMTAQQLHDAAARMRGVPGSRAVLPVVRFANGLSESIGESRGRVMMHRAGLPAPALQFDVYDERGRWLGRSDYSWHGGRLLGEFDVKIKYGQLLKPGQSPCDVVFNEKRREDLLRDTGARVVRFVWAELDQPAEAIERISRALASVERDLRC